MGIKADLRTTCIVVVVMSRILFAVFLCFLALAWAEGEAVNDKEIAAGVEEVAASNTVVKREAAASPGKKKKRKSKAKKSKKRNNKRPDKKKGGKINQRNQRKEITKEGIKNFFQKEKA